MNIFYSSNNFTVPNSGCAIALGFFDGVHIGHRSILDRTVDVSHKMGLLPIAYSFTNHPSCALYPERIVSLLDTLEERLEKISSLGLKCVCDKFDSELASLEAINFLDDILEERLKVKAIICGYNHTFGKDAKGNPEFLIEWGRKKKIYVEIVPPTIVDGESISSSLIRRIIGEGRVGEARKLLGSPFKVRGKVVAGQHLGRRWGFPTANIIWPKEKVTVALGAYACSVQLSNGKIFPAVGYFGSRPTVSGNEHNRYLEVNLGYWNGNRVQWNDKIFDDDKQGEFQLYGKDLSVNFEKFLAPQQHFKNMKELSERIAEYRSMASKILYKTK